MGGKIESDANMNNQRINLHTPTVDILPSLFAQWFNPTHWFEQISEMFVKNIFMKSEAESVYFVAKNIQMSDVYLCGISFNLEL